MATDTLHHHQHFPTRGELPRWIVVGALAGAASVLLFHQGLAALLHALELTARAPYSLQPTRPLGVPVIASIAFWGAVWGTLLATTLARLEGARLVLAALVFGAVFPTLVSWFAVAPLKGQPIAGGFAPAAMAVGVMVNAAWGLGSGLGLALFGRRRGAE